MSQQYWTATVYAASDVFHRAWDEFQQNLYDDAEWQYSSAGDAEWDLTRTRSLDSYDNEGHAGDIGIRRYSDLVDAIQRIQGEIDRERQRLEEEKRRREAVERRERESALASISDAVLDAGKALSNQDFERAQAILRGHSTVYNQYQNELNFSEYDDMLNKIQHHKAEWVKQTIASIQNMVSQKKWDEAKEMLDGVRSERISSTGTQSQIDALRAKLNKEKKEWEAAEKERLRLEKIANENRAKQIVEEKVENWSPKIFDVDLVSDKLGSDVFMEELKSSQDWGFLEQHSDWSKGRTSSSIKSKSNGMYQQAISSYISNLVSELITKEISRENILSDDILSGEMNPMKVKDMSQVLSDGIQKHFSKVWEYVSKNKFEFSREMVEVFTIQFVEARTIYIEEVKRAKNTELAKAMVGNLLGMQTEMDFVTMVGAAYIGDHKVRFFTDVDGIRKELTDGPQIVEHIQSGSDLIIVLEDCYETEQELETERGWIKNRKIFEN